MKIAARRSRPSDWFAIQELQRKAYRKLPRSWWWEEHLEDDSFIITERDESIVGALFAWPDDSPVAWVRLAALDDTLNVDRWLNLALPLILDSLSRRGTQRLAWMDYHRWAEPHLETQGFRRLTTVVTLTKLERTLPKTKPSGVYLRPVADADIPTVVALGRAAFSPHWWNSEATMYRRSAIPSHFIVAETDSRVVGYAEGEVHLPTAHLNRIAVRPTHQGHSIGTMLLESMLHAFWRLGAERVTLNTQADNLPSQRLYHRFGFTPTGDSATVWELSF